MGLSVNFYHVPTQYNPADAGTRGLAASDIAHHDWLRGPLWLRQDPEELPPRFIEKIYEKLEIDVDEIIQPNIVAPPRPMTAPSEPFIELARFSQYSKVLRVIATIGKVVRSWVDKCNTHRTTRITLQTVSEFSSDKEITAGDIRLGERLLFSLQHRGISVEELRKKLPEV
ncbi:hypothetical protein Y032_0180g772 [Ancylostoma ceylanicum]|uniref:Uncharacterized protein n=1 Tax=Ancylostoma ceylanicum TaxID=53326 RepID=A0A016ST72_9BILA|nr:hypothetical protein Y032_0180g772 [Ancylostoma ceylanicum]